MRLEDFDYELPPERIAQEPAARREEARLLVYRRDEGTRSHAGVRDLPDLLEAGDLLCLNDTRVLPARLFGRRASGARVEFLFVEPTSDERVWTVLCNPARKLRPGEALLLADGAVRAFMVERPADAEGRPGAHWLCRLEEVGNEEEAVAGILERYGRIPLPPYIERDADAREPRSDRERYQTVYARARGAVAAPTAGLHFTEALLAELEGRGIERAFVTLHVGPGTFRPIDSETVEDHRMHSERYVLPAATVEAIERTKERGGRVVCVGTTTVRALEGVVAAEGALRPSSGRTELFIHPGFPFRVCDALLTNFHLPRSSLLVLVSALVGRERTLELYREAIAEGYRFYSYGDAMLVL